MRGLPRMLVVTNDFPPRVGGAQRYIHDLVRHLPPDRVAVFAPSWPGARDFDVAEPYPVHRWTKRRMTSASEVRRRVRELVRETNADMVLFGHALLLGLMGPELVSNLGVPYAALTHGAEVWMAGVPVSMRALKRALSRASIVFAVSEYTRSRIRRAVPESVPLEVLWPGVDASRFHPGADGLGIRERHGLDGHAVVTCVSRLVPRKGQDVLIRGWPEVLGRIPEARLLVVGDGPQRSRLERLARDEKVNGGVVFAGEVPEEELPAHYAAGDIFAMPCRSRVGGLQVEGFGIVYIEAGACGRASIAGSSGGAAEAVADGRTGLVIDGADVWKVSDSVATLLEDPDRARSMGAAGRARVERDFDWPAVVRRLARLLRSAIS